MVAQRGVMIVTIISQFISFVILYKSIQ